MIELHLDLDEWSAILDALQEKRNRADDAGYEKYLEAILLKIECATAEVFGDPRTPSYGVGQ